MTQFLVSHHSGYYSYYLDYCSFVNRSNIKRKKGMKKKRRCKQRILGSATESSVISNSVLSFVSTNKTPAVEINHAVQELTLKSYICGLQIINLSELFVCVREDKEKIPHAFFLTRSHPLLVSTTIIMYGRPLIAKTKTQIFARRKQVLQQNINYFLAGESKTTALF